MGVFLNWTIKKLFKRNIKPGNKYLSVLLYSITTICVNLFIETFKVRISTIHIIIKQFISKIRHLGFSNVIAQNAFELDFLESKFQSEIS